MTKIKADLMFSAILWPVS